MADLWFRLPVLAQDMLLLGALLAPVIVLGTVLLRGFRLAPLLLSILRRERGTALVFLALIAVSVGIGVAVTAQDRALRDGSARAAQKFDLIVAAPGSETTLMFAAVYLQPADVDLIDGATFDRIAAHPRVTLAAPLAFGDSWQGAPIVGSTAQFVHHLSDGLSEGRMFTAETEAIAGARVALAIGDRFEPAHGVGLSAEAGAHGFDYTVVGRMPLTGSPWDRALIVPVESVWMTHGLASGHGPGWDGTLGPPFDPAHFPGTPAVLVRGETLADAYGLRSTFNRNGTMAFFPGTVLARLHALLGDVTEVMRVLAVLTQILVAGSVLVGLAMIARLMARRTALLRTLGAPRRFVFALVWSIGTALVTAGAGLGLLLGLGASRAVGRIVTARTDILVTPTLGWAEAHLVAGFVLVAALLALLPAWAAMRRPILTDLRTS